MRKHAANTDETFYGFSKEGAILWGELCRNCTYSIISRNDYIREYLQ